MSSLLSLAQALEMKYSQGTMRWKTEDPFAPQEEGEEEAPQTQRSPGSQPDLFAQPRAQYEELLNTLHGRVGRLLQWSKVSKPDFKGRSYHMEQLKQLLEAAEKVSETFD